MGKPFVDRAPGPDDLLTARQLANEYGYELQVAENIVRNLKRRGLVEVVPGFKRDFVRRRHVEPQSSGGTT